MLNTDNKLYCGDNLKIMYGMPDESIDLIYLDPPFFSGKNYEVIWGDKAEIRSFDDRFEGGIMVYVEWMKDRLEEMYRILKPTGSIYLHVDHHAVHYLKVEMDKIFGMGNFRNNIVWCYSGGGASKSKFATKHDDILFYSKTDKYLFNTQYTQYKNPNGKHSGGKPYREEGKLMDDWWIDLPGVSSNAKERLGYPTQKPESLLKRIIKASSNPGDIVFDPFCGCGTSIAVAQRLKRSFIGIDISPIACEVIARSDRVRYPIDEIIGLPKTAEDIKKMEPHEFQNWVCQKMQAINTSPNSKTASGGDGGIDGVIQTPLTNPKYHGAPIQVKHSKDKNKGIGVNVVRNFFAAMHENNKKTGFIVGISFGSGAKELVAKYRNEGSVRIHLLTVEDIIDSKDLSDITSKLKE